MEPTRKIFRLFGDSACFQVVPVVEETMSTYIALDSLLSTMKDALRPESDCILIARPGAVAGLNPVITHNRYFLTDQTIPFSIGSVASSLLLIVPGSMFRNRQSLKE